MANNLDGLIDGLVESVEEHVRLETQENVKAVSIDRKIYSVSFAAMVLKHSLFEEINSSDMPEQVKTKLISNINVSVASTIMYVNISVEVPSIYEEIDFPYESGNLANIYDTGTTFKKVGNFYGTDDTGRRFDMKLSKIPGMTHPATHYAERALVAARKTCSDCGIFAYIFLNEEGE